LSTGWMLDAGCEVWCVEHDKRFWEKLQEDLAGRGGWTGVRLEACRRDSDYATMAIRWAAGADGKFDLAFVDGRRRVECVLAARLAVRAGGVIILHDWKRWNYQVLIRSVPDLEILEEADNTVVLRRVVPKPKRVYTRRKKEADV
jgi:hypothetical protein